jgi:hypothetical protein
VKYVFEKIVKTKIKPLCTNNTLLASLCSLTTTLMMIFVRQDIFFNKVITDKGTEYDTELNIHDETRSSIS